MGDESKFDTVDHTSHMRRAIELAHQAAERGDRPFGSVLVRDDEIVMSESNRVVTDHDIRRHPELHLAYRACRELSAAERADIVMYTSTEPCPMCSGGMRQASFAGVIFGVSSAELAEFTDVEPTARAADNLDGITAVSGPVLNDEARRLHDDFDW